MKIGFRTLTLMSVMAAAVLFISGCSSSNDKAPGKTAAARNTDHLPLDLTSAEYSKIIEANHVANQADIGDQDPEVKKILGIGKRNLDWVKKINDTRPKDQWILLSSKELQQGIPMDKPQLYNDSTVVSQYQQRLVSLPAAFRDILLGMDDLPTTPPISDADFATAARLIDKSYQNASRWLIMEPNLGYMAAIRASDIRGYYFLTHLADRETKLAHYSTLSAADQKQVQEWLLEMCYNSTSDDIVCADEFDTAVASQGDLNSLYAKYLKTSADIFDSFFHIPTGEGRTDITHSGVNGLETFSIPFIDPAVDKILHFVKDNVEDEWHTSAFALKVAMQPTGDTSTTPHIVFQSGATPHVDAISGNTITMDQNVSLDDYGNQWTIRHEFGHVLGFPDCYIEFYDSVHKIIVDYQLDLDNLMCSRKGHLLPSHVSELQHVYGAKL